MKNLNDKLLKHYIYSIYDVEIDSFGDWIRVDELREFIKNHSIQDIENELNRYDY